MLALLGLREPREIAIGFGDEAVKARSNEDASLPRSTEVHVQPLKSQTSLHTALEMAVASLVGTWAIVVLDASSGNIAVGLLHRSSHTDVLGLRCAQLCLSLRLE